MSDRSKAMTQTVGDTMAFQVGDWSWGRTHSVKKSSFETSKASDIGKEHTMTSPAINNGRVGKSRI
jgi:hypothetical protein